MTEEEAIAIVESVYARQRSAWPDAEAILVMRGQSRRTATGYVFRLSTRRHIETGATAFAAYLGPVVVNERTREVVELPTSVDAEEGLGLYAAGDIDGTVLNRF